MRFWYFGSKAPLAVSPYAAPGAPASQASPSPPGLLAAAQAGYQKMHAAWRGAVDPAAAERARRAWAVLDTASRIDPLMAAVVQLGSRATLAGGLMLPRGALGALLGSIALGVSGRELSASLAYTAQLAAACGDVLCAQAVGQMSCEIQAAQVVLEQASLIAGHLVPAAPAPAHPAPARPQAPVRTATPAASPTPLPGNRPPRARSAPATPPGHHDVLAPDRPRSINAALAALGRRRPASAPAAVQPRPPSTGPHAAAPIPAAAATPVTATPVTATPVAATPVAATPAAAGARAATPVGPRHEAPALHATVNAGPGGTRDDDTGGEHSPTPPRNGNARPGSQPAAGQRRRDALARMLEGVHRNYGDEGVMLGGAPALGDDDTPAGLPDPTAPMNQPTARPTMAIDAQGWLAEVNETLARGRAALNHYLLTPHARRDLRPLIEIEGHLSTLAEEGAAWDDLISGNLKEPFQQLRLLEDELAQATNDERD